MDWLPSAQEVAAVPKMPGPARYQYTVKKIADQEKLWSLWNGGWALASTSPSMELIPIWPHSFYAELCASGDWSDYIPKPISLDEWLRRWVLGIAEDKRRVAVFPTADDKGVVVDPQEFADHIYEELQRYE